MDRFRGSAPARLDEKGRLKVPNVFRQQIEEVFGPEMFVTSLHGAEVLLYPEMAVQDYCWPAGHVCVHGERASAGGRGKDGRLDRLLHRIAQL